LLCIIGVEPPVSFQQDMGMGKPRRITPTDNWEQLQLFITSPEQERYEEIRPILLFGQPPGTRARETGTPAHTLRRRADRFVVQGMLSLFALMHRHRFPNPFHQHYSRHFHQNFAR